MPLRGGIFGSSRAWAHASRFSHTPASAGLCSRQNNVRYVHARSLTPQEREFIHRDAECRNQRIKGDVTSPSEFIRHAFGSESGVQFALSRDAFFTCCHLLPFLFSDRGDGVITHVECACDCANGITVRECVYDALPNCKGAELCVVTFWLRTAWLR